MHAARLERIITHTRRINLEVISETFLIIRRLVPLGDQDMLHDHYRQFGWCGGFLCYDRYYEVIEAVRPTSFVCQFAKTSMSVEGVAEKCAHVLPQSRVSL